VLQQLRAQRLTIRHNQQHSVEEGIDPSVCVALCRHRVDNWREICGAVQTNGLYRLRVRSKQPSHTHDFGAGVVAVEGERVTDHPLRRQLGAVAEGLRRGGKREPKGSSGREQIKSADIVGYVRLVLLTWNSCRGS